ncbi:hypothetical protein [Massilia sp.]|uniref:hypothetical protein n=1 Tax=Massilia sp. TaxID=1882437 RepID=UPI00289E7B76|nr:hypothetical protein [Massilia sp.]
MRDDTLAPSQPPVPSPAAPGGPAAEADHPPDCGQNAAPPGDVLCRDGAYPGRVTAVRKAVERNAAFGC